MTGAVAIDDGVLLPACLSGNEHAWETFEERFGLLMFTVVCFVIDERRGGSMEEAQGCYDEVLRQLRKDPSELRPWTSAASRLRTFLPLAIRPLIVRYLQDVTPPATLLTSLPAGAFVKEPANEPEPVSQAMASLEGLPILEKAAMRFRLWDFDVAATAACLGVHPSAVSGALDRVAECLAKACGSPALWRVAMRTAHPSEIVARYIEDSEDPILLEELSQANSIWTSLRKRTRAVPKPRTPDCFDDLTIAGFVDGSLKGARRTRAETHLTQCPRCLDAVAGLTQVLDSVAIFRDLGARGAVDVPPHLAAAAAAIADGRYRAGFALSEHVPMSPRARDLGRLARVGATLRETDPPRVEPTAELSGVLRTIVPTDHEAPIVALEALASGDELGAARAIDDEVAKTVLGSRLRLLASAAGHDLEGAQQLTSELEVAASRDPQLEEDVELVRALPASRVLPRELLLDRLEAALPAAARLTLSR